MTARKRSPRDQWEQELNDDFQDFQWHVALDPLYEPFQRWKKGEISHLELHKSIHNPLKECQQVYSLFNNKRDFLVKVIQLHEDWFPNWVKAHPKPAAQAIPENNSAPDKLYNASRSSTGNIYVSYPPH